jgi:hypothetical protein
MAMTLIGMAALGAASAGAQSPATPVSPPTSGTAPVTPPTTQELQALAARPQAALMPRDTRDANRTGPPPGAAAAVPVGARISTGAPGQPGGTIARAGTRPVRRSFRITCRRSTRTRWTCVARDKRTRSVVRRCSSRRLRTAQQACIRYVRQPPRSRSRSVGGLQAGAARLTWNGWPTRAMSAVGKIYTPTNNLVGYCSATVVTRTLVLTAGHCLTQNGVSKPYVNFVPGHSWSTAAIPDSISAPFGVWRTTAQHWWVPQGWLNGNDPALDWGLVEFGPDAAGRYIGDVVGAWTITPSIRLGTGAHIYVVGYPTSGYWKTDAGLNGRGQYACDTNWDGDGRYIGSGYEIYTACYMNRGASGGPWFVQLNNGTWTIGGVSNRCQGPNENDPTRYCDPYSDYLRSSYMSDRFLEFWNGVQPLLGR